MQAGSSDHVDQGIEAARQRKSALPLAWRHLIGVIARGIGVHLPAKKMPVKAGVGSDSKDGSRKTAGTNPTAPERACHRRRKAARDAPLGKRGRSRSGQPATKVPRR